jgi:hypothetical protein
VPVLPEGLPREGLRREVLRLQAERRVPLMERHSGQAELPCPEHPEAARPGVPAGPHRERPACPSAAVAPMALASGPPAAEPQVVPLTAEQVVLRSEPEEQGVLAAPRREVPRASAAQPQAVRAELAVSGEGVVLQPAARVAGWDAAAEPRQVAGSGAAVLLPVAAEAEEQDVVAAVQRQAAGPASAAVRLREAEVAAPDAEEARLRGALAGVLAAAEVPQRVARDEGVLLLAAAWAELPSTRLQGARLAPSAWAPSAHARGGLRTAQP